MGYSVAKGLRIWGCPSPHTQLEKFGETCKAVKGDVLTVMFGTYVVLVKFP